MKNVTVENFRRLPDDEYKECESIPHMELLDKPSKKEQRRKEACPVISFAWLLGMEFMAQFIVQ